MAKQTVQRRCRNWLLCLWPGLPGTWEGGRAGSLVVAVAASLTAQAVLIVWLVWPELLQPPLRTVVCFVVALFWCGCVARNLATQARRTNPDRPNGTDHLFQSAQLEYLRGDWVAAENTLTRILTRHPNDSEARLLLVTVYRRSQQPQKAQRELERLASLPSARSWKDEIQRERSYVVAEHGPEQPQIAIAKLDAA